jgi:prefoldin subunit 5
MKVIGFGRKEELILSGSKDEMAHLKGEHSSYGMKIEVGGEFTINKIYQDATDTLKSYLEIKSNLEKLQKDIARLLSMMKPE